jgi:hypothetical protein
LGANNTSKINGGNNINQNISGYRNGAGQRRHRGFEDVEEIKLDVLDLQSLVMAWRSQDPSSIPEQQIQLVKDVEARIDEILHKKVIPHHSYLWESKQVSLRILPKYPKKKKGEVEGATNNSFKISKRCW